jgi:hypothetical protein
MRLSTLLSKHLTDVGNIQESNSVIVIYLTSSCVILAFFGMSGPV